MKNCKNYVYLLYKITIKLLLSTDACKTPYEICIGQETLVIYLAQGG